MVHNMFCFVHPYKIEFCVQADKREQKSTVSSCLIFTQLYNTDYRFYGYKLV